jgi:processive 1,2-diacylglycerol beta-glucosyltransferase
MSRDGIRLTILHATVGTGHTVAAKALSEWCRLLYPDSEVEIVDLLNYVPRLLDTLITSAYLSLARRYPWAWERLYKDTDVRSGIAAGFWSRLGGMLSWAGVRKLIRDLDEFKPDAVITTHFFGMPALLGSWEHSTPIYFVNTDYATHLLQRDPRFDGWFAGSDEAVRQYHADGIPAIEITVKNFGIPISRAYSRLPDRAAARASLDVRGDAAMVTVTGGGIGGGSLGVVADSMLDHPDWHVEVICGDNAREYNKLRDKYFPFKHINVRGFVNNMQDYYVASDVVVIKPGGLTSAEAAAAGAVMLLLEPLPGVERYNCDYLLEHGAARKIYENRRVGEQVEEILKSPSEMKRLRVNALELGRPFAARDIIRSVVEPILAGNHILDDDADAQRQDETRIPSRAPAKHKFAEVEV